MPGQATGWSPNTHRLVSGTNWRIGRSRDAFVALRGRNGTRVEEIRLVDRTRSRKLDWASNTVIVQLRGNFHTDTESELVYRLSRAWWQRRSQVVDIGIRCFFEVTTRTDGRYDVSLQLRGTHENLPHARESLGGDLPLSASNPEIWESTGLQLIDIATAVLQGQQADAMRLHLHSLERRV